MSKSFDLDAAFGAPSKLCFSSVFSVSAPWSILSFFPTVSMRFRLRRGGTRSQNGVGSLTKRRGCREISKMEWQSHDKELKAAGAELLDAGGSVGICLRNWEIESFKRSILSSSLVQQWEEKLQTSHLPERVFGESSLVLKHANSGIKIYFNAFDDLCGWKQEVLPPVEVPAADKWKFRLTKNLEKPQIEE